MATRTWSVPVPAEGIAMVSVVIQGSGKDLDLYLRRQGRPALKLPLAGVRVGAADDVELDVTPLDDVSLSLTYSAPRLLLTAARISWTEDEWNAELEEELTALFDDTADDDRTRHELRDCFHVEISLASRPVPRA
ncbi:hypothetical protein FZ103_03385 [Streptomonospora sp. PA3]|uniref:hypothetical protein n=1 Tax=Streptomonospora sp. PA3 TaxID=2607326 RepID=UPI0012DC6712|nr:hypothetical protein [Streptomonospora sp. PA3]MUL40229.1 hypothetical protein [Streptomonospora sp. PA3]